jgi:IS1 family transposase
MAVKISTSFGDVNSLKSQILVNLLVENVIIVAYENQLIKIIGYVFGSRQTKTAACQQGQGENG